MHKYGRKVEQSVRASPSPPREFSLSAQLIICPASVLLKFLEGRGTQGQKVPTLFQNSVKNLPKWSTSEV